MADRKHWWAVRTGEGYWAGRCAPISYWTPQLIETQAEARRIANEWRADGYKAKPVKIIVSEK